MTDLPELEKYHTPAQVAVIFEVKADTVRTWIKEGKIRYIKLPGGQLRIPESAVRELAQQRYGA